MCSSGKGKKITRRTKKIIRIKEKVITVFTMAFGEEPVAFAMKIKLDAE